MHDLPNFELVDDTFKKKVWSSLGITLMALERRPEDYLSEGFYAECLGAFFRSCSPRRVEELLEVESFGHRRFGLPAATG